MENFTGCTLESAGEEKISYLTNLLELSQQTIALKDNRIRHLEKQIENLSLGRSVLRSLSMDNKKIGFTCDASTRSDPMKEWSLDVVICFDAKGNCVKLDVPRTWIKPKTVHEIVIPNGHEVTAIAVCTQNVGGMRISLNSEEFTIDCVHWSDSRYRDGQEWTSEYNRLARYWAFTYIDIKEQSSTFMPFSQLPRSVHEKLDKMKYFQNSK